MKKRHRLRNFFVWFFSFWILAFLALLLILKVPLAEPSLAPATFAPRRLPKSLPALSFQVFETGYSEAPEAYMRQGGSLRKQQRMTHSAVLLRHPKGNIVIDSGFGSHFSEEVAQSPWIHRLFARFFIPTLPLVKNPDFPALNPDHDFFLISHVHWDHVGGLRDFPHIPIKMLQAEQNFAQDARLAKQHGVLPYQITAIQERIQALVLQDVPYENFAQSLDIFGDGSVVAVSLAGHTPGSMGVFVNLNDGHRYLLVGDALWSVTANGRPEARSRLAEWTSDFDKMQARAVRLRLDELIQHSNEVTLVPIHDSVALKKLKPLYPKFL